MQPPCSRMQPHAVLSTRMQPHAGPHAALHAPRARTPQVSRVLPGPAGKLQALAAAGRLETATPEALGLSSSTGEEVGRTLVALMQVYLH